MLFARSRRQLDRTATDLLDSTNRITALADILTAETQPAAKLRIALDQVHKTYDAVIKAIAIFEAAALDDDRASRREYAKLRGKRLKAIVRDGLGHCHLIHKAYYGKGGLEWWLSNNAPKRTQKRAERAFAKLVEADLTLFFSLRRVGDLLTNEASAIVNLFITSTPPAAKRRIVRAYERLAPLRRELDEGFEALHTLEQRVGYVHEVSST